MGKIIFLTGPVRSGKSRHAVERAKGWGSEVVFVASYQNRPDDLEMQERVRRHQAERPAWRVLEAPANISDALDAMRPPPSGVLLDSLTLWASARFEKTDAEIYAEWTGQLKRFAESPWDSIIVSDEIGWTPVPGDPALRRFRDIVGTLGQMTAAAAEEALLLVAGYPLRLK